MNAVAPGPRASPQWDTRNQGFISPSQLQQMRRNSTPLDLSDPPSSSSPPQPPLPQLQAQDSSRPMQHRPSQTQSSRNSFFSFRSRQSMEARNRQQEGHLAADAPQPQVRSSVLRRQQGEARMTGSSAPPRQPPIPEMEPNPPPPQLAPQPPQPQPTLERGPTLRDGANAPLHPEIKSVVQLTLAHAHKIYFSGPMTRKIERQPDGQKPAKDEGWTEVWAQLGGTTLSVWDMKKIEEASKQGREVPPTYINVTDAFIQVLGAVTMPPTNNRPAEKYTNVLTVNTAGSNLLLFACPSPAALISWAAALRLSAWEKSRLEEIYTAHLIRITLGDGRKAPTSLIHGRMEGWVRIRLAGQTDWKRCWMALAAGAGDGDTESRASSPSASRKRRVSTLFSRTSHDLDSGGLPQRPSIALYASPKPRDKKRPLLTFKDVSQAFAVYPERPELISKSTLMKLEGTIGEEETAGVMKGREGWLLVMPELEGGNSQASEMLKWVIAVHDAFSMYGRPQGYTWDPRDSTSMMFAYPVGPGKDLLFLDREVAESLDPRDERTSAVRSGLLNLMVVRMRSASSPDARLRLGPGPGPASPPGPGSGMYTGPSPGSSPTSTPPQLPPIGNVGSSSPPPTSESPSLPPLDFGSKPSPQSPQEAPVPFAQESQSSPAQRTPFEAGALTPITERSTRDNSRSMSAEQNRSLSMDHARSQSGDKSPVRSPLGRGVPPVLEENEESPHLVKSPSPIPGDYFGDVQLPQGASPPSPPPPVVPVQDASPSVPPRFTTALSSNMASSPPSVPPRFASPMSSTNAPSPSIASLSPALPSQLPTPQRQTSLSPTSPGNASAGFLPPIPTTSAPPVPPPKPQARRVSPPQSSNDLFAEAGALYYMQQMDEPSPVSGAIGRRQPVHQVPPHPSGLVTDTDEDENEDEEPEEEEEEEEYNSGHVPPVPAYSPTEAVRPLRVANRSVSPPSERADLGRGQAQVGRSVPGEFASLTAAGDAGSSSSRISLTHRPSGARAQPATRPISQNQNQTQPSSTTASTTTARNMAEPAQPTSQQRRSFEDPDADALAALTFLESESKPTSAPAPPAIRAVSPPRSPTSPTLAYDAIETGPSQATSAQQQQFKSSFAPSKQAAERKARSQAHQAAHQAAAHKPGRANGKRGAVGGKTKDRGAWGESSDEEDEDEDDEDEEAGSDVSAPRATRSGEGPSPSPSRGFLASSHESAGDLQGNSQLRPPRHLPQVPGNRSPMSGSQEYLPMNARPGLEPTMTTDSLRRTHYEEPPRMQGNNQLRPQSAYPPGGASRQTVWSSVLESDQQGPPPAGQLPTRDTFVQLEPVESSMARAFTPHGLLSAGLQDKQDRSAKRQEELARESGASLLNIPNKPPPPQTGLLGAITAHERERKREGGFGAALTERERERRAAEERQRKLDDYQRQQLEQMSQAGSMYGGQMMGMNPMMGMGMNPMMMNPMMGMNPMMTGYGMMGGYGQNPQQMFAQQQAMQAYQQAMMAFSVAGSQAGGPDGSQHPGQMQPQQTGQSQQLAPMNPMMTGMGGFDPRMSMMGMPMMGMPMGQLGMQPTGGSMYGGGMLSPQPQFDPGLRPPGDFGGGAPGQMHRFSPAASSAGSPSGPRPVDTGDEPPRMSMSNGSPQPRTPAA